MMIVELFLGVLVGLVMALTGAGGGILAVPLLVFGAGMEVDAAAPIGLLAVGLAAASGAAIALRARILRYRAALWMATFGMLAAPAGVALSRQVGNQWLTILFSGVLAFVAIRTWIQAGVDTPPAVTAAQDCRRSDVTGRFIWTSRCARVLAASGGFAGLLSGLLGVGGGFVIVPALQRYTDLAIQSVIATSLAVIALVSLSGVTSSALAGNLDWLVALPFAGGTMAGVLGGRLVATRLRGPLLQRGFAIVAAMVAAGLPLQAFS